ncbi:MCE family protein [Williamsia sp. SKLECPSW1]
MRSRTVIGVALFVVVALGLTWTMWSTLLRPVSGRTVTYTATFTDASGVRPGDDVRMAGVRVGRVESLALDGTLARVRFSVQSDQSVYQDTKVLIRYQNLIGQRYLALTLPFGSHKVRRPSDLVFDTAHTEPAFDVSKLLNGFQPLFDVLKPEQINSLSTLVVKTLQGDGVSVSALIAESASLAEEFATKDDILGDILTNLSSVVDTLATHNIRTRDLIRDAARLVGALDARRATVTGALDQTATVAARLDGVLDDVDPIFPAAVTNLSSVVDLINMNGPQLTTTVGADLPQFLAAFSRVSQNGSYLNVYDCNLDVSLAGVLFPPGLFAQVGGQRHSEVCR